ncbi:MAG TPA: nickel ABC transporter permease [Symbiobacteriaceae bacterium]|jgi:ABC-type dipeptide/oligopeptide/nickel transport system permease component|nr:nickel ABC transporter permease [Symbiobacteriaceae bacterium]
MLRYAARRLLLLVPVLLGVTLLVFAIFYLTPGDPARVVLGDQGQGATPEALEALRHQLGLDRPWYVQYGDFVARAVQGDLGRSFRGDRPVATEVLTRFPATLQLTVVSLGLAALLGIPMGVLAAVKRNTWVDYLVMLAALLGVSLPTFWFGIMLMQLFALKWKALPPSGTGTWQHMVLPAVTVALSSVAFIARMTRSALLDQLREDYVRTARSKGLQERVVIFGHALRNAFIPVLTTLGLQFGSLLGGAVVVESIFSLPGLGRLTVDAIKGRDLPMIQGAVLWVALIFSLVNLAVDMGYAALDPRIRYD